jgi:aminopeptidase N
MRRTALACLVCSAAACVSAAPPQAPQPDPPRPAETVAVVPARAEEPAPIEAGRAAPHGPYAPGFDALNYDIALELPDTGSSIRARTTIRIARTAPRTDTLTLDFSGLIVDGVALNSADTPFSYAAGRIRVPLVAELVPRDTFSVAVRYHGVPDDGLLIRNNVHGRRAVFADNWPNRARYWFPSIDHPSDKATVRFAVSAPARWHVIANGQRLPGNVPSGLLPDPQGDYGPRALWRWGTTVPIPTYTMVIGAAEFTASTPRAACSLSPQGCVEVSWWVFPEDTASAARSFGRGAEMVELYTRLFGPFPYEKLVHVQSSTRYGGMENASAIFYDEKALAAGQDIESTVAHETVHQWFGDGVTERDWHDLWLSEGFATYFAAVFFEHANGVARFREMLRADRDAYFKSNAVERPVVDSAQTNLFELLNANSYQKGGLVLHMLRGMLGDSAFYTGVRDYYNGHRNGTATTADFRASMERASRRDLRWFFQQWLYEPGYPRLRVSHSWNTQRTEAQVTIEQMQPDTWPTFRLPLTLEFTVNGRSVRRSVELQTRRDVLQVQLPGRPTRVVVDPDDWLLRDVVAQ